MHFVRLVRRLFLALINNLKKILLEFSTAIIFQIPNPANLPVTSAQGHNNMMVQLLVLEAISLFTIVHNSQDVIRELYWREQGWFGGKSPNEWPLRWSLYCSITSASCIEIGLCPIDLFIDSNLSFADVILTAKIGTECPKKLSVHWNYYHGHHKIILP